MVILWETANRKLHPQIASHAKPQFPQTIPVALKEKRMMEATEDLLRHHRPSQTQENVFSPMQHTSVNGSQEILLGFVKNESCRSIQSRTQKMYSMLQARKQ